MRAELNEHGVLTVMPETPTEAYALRRWGEQSVVMMRSEALNEELFVRGSAILISFSLPAATGSASHG